VIDLRNRKEVTLNDAGNIQEIALNERHPLTVADKTAFACDDL
jgi:hypothetical protein